MFMIPSLLRVGVEIRHLVHMALGLLLLVAAAAEMQSRGVCREVLAHSGTSGMRSRVGLPIYVNVQSEEVHTELTGAQFPSIVADTKTSQERI